MEFANVGTGFCIPGRLRLSHTANKLFGFQLREQDHVADAFLAEEHHAQAVNAHAHAAGGRHSVFEHDEKIFIQLLLFAGRRTALPACL